MRLLNTRSLEFSCVYVPNRVPDYVILSHRWGSEEVTYADIIQAPLSEPASVTRNKAGFLKVQEACALALQNGYEWIWIDSCCIDKSSSAELQETINLMWKYYKESNICFAYLEDVVDPEAGWGNDQPVGKSEWFTRGWTLQELIAPYNVEFYSSGWQPIGTKLERYQELADITGIDPDILCNYRRMSTPSTAEKLSWAAHRAVTKEEDEAYSLFGLFDVNLPLLYGEGRLKAFARLQEAIYDTTSDHSIFLFLHSRNSNGHPLLAESPSQFCNRKICKICPDQEDENYSTYFSYAKLVKSERWHRQAHEKIMITVTMWRNEVSTVFPLLDYPEIKDRLSYFDDLRFCDNLPTHVALLNYTVSACKEGILCLLLRQQPGQDATMRLQVLPALLSLVEDDIAWQLKKRRILIRRSEPSLRERESIHDTETKFCFKSGLFSIEDETLAMGGSMAKHNTQDDIGRNKTLSQIDDNKRFKFQATSSPSTAGWKLVDTKDRTLILRLMQEFDIWSIREVLAPKEKGVRVTHEMPTFLKANKPSDRLAVTLPDGERVFVKLQRLPAFARGHADGQTAKLRYMISVESEVK
ncbi:unnamed protein product [Alternaria alternata]